MDVSMTWDNIDARRVVERGTRGPDETRTRETFSTGKWRRVVMNVHVRRQASTCKICIWVILVKRIQR